jgi:hypothetical protein
MSAAPRNRSWRRSQRCWAASCVAPAPACHRLHRTPGPRTCHRRANAVSGEVCPPHRPGLDRRLGPEVVAIRLDSRPREGQNGDQAHGPTLAGAALMPCPRGSLGRQLDRRGSVPARPPPSHSNIRTDPRRISAKGGRRQACMAIGLAPSAPTAHRQDRRFRLRRPRIRTDRNHFRAKTTIMAWSPARANPAGRRWQVEWAESGIDRTRRPYDFVESTRGMVT